MKYLFAASEVFALGRSGISKVALAKGVCRHCQIFTRDLISPYYAAAYSQDNCTQKQKEIHIKYIMPT